MVRKMTVVFHDEELYTELKVLAIRQRKTASDIVAEAVREWIETREDERDKRARSEVKKSSEIAQPSGVTRQPATLGVLRETRVAYSPGRVQSKKRIFVPERALAEFCRRSHIRRLSVFGSALREDFRPDSDVDVLVEFEPEGIPGLLKLAELETELSVLFGRKVDLRTPGDLSRHIREGILKEAEVQYASAG